MGKKENEGTEMPRLRKYEVRVYNGFVREMLDAGEQNVTEFSDYWAEAHYIEIIAPTLVAAINRVHKDYPEEAGFVVTAIEEMPDPV